MKMKIGAKLGLAFAAVLALMMISGVLTYFRLSEIQRNEDLMTDIRIPSMEIVRMLQNDLNFNAAKARQSILAATDPGRRASSQEAFEKSWAAVDHNMEKLSPLAARWSLQVNKDRFAELKSTLPKIRQAQQPIIDSAAAGRDSVILAGNSYVDKVTPVVDGATKNLGDLAESLDDLLDQNDKASAAANVSAEWTLVISIAFAVVVGAVLAFFISRGISSSTNLVLEQASSIAGGDLSRDELVIKSQDELGDLTGAVNRMQTSLRNLLQSIGANARNVAAASEEFSSVSQQIAANSEETSAQANAVSAATEEVNRSLETVSTATGEMTTSIQDIAKNATEASRVASEAMKTAQETNTVVTKLGVSSAEIGQVIKVITSIAQKTDLLALNATVEAARAGDVGAGFAVVANEVKELAKQTAAATEDISRRIEAIQTDAKGAVSAIEAISGIVSRVNEISASIAAAVEEQSATTNEMSRNLSEATKGAGEVAQNIHGVAQAAQNTSQGASDSKKAANQLAKMSTELQGLVDQFKVERNNNGGSRRNWDDSADEQAVRRNAQQSEADARLVGSHQ